MILRFLHTICNPKFAVGANSIREVPKDLAKALLSRRDALGKPVVEVLTNPTGKVLPLVLNEDETPWGLEDSENE